MTYQQKTTVVTIHTYWAYNRRYDVSIEMLYSTQRDLAIITANRCEMDIMSISQSPKLRNGLTYTTVVYVNNGKTLDEIVALVKPEMEITQRYWTVIDVYSEHGGIVLAICMEKGDGEVEE